MYEGPGIQDPQTRESEKYEGPGIQDNPSFLPQDFWLKHLWPKFWLKIFWIGRKQQKKINEIENRIDEK